MALYAIGDLHLSLSGDKSMEVFGGRWENYVEKIKTGFSGLREDDVSSAATLPGGCLWKKRGKTFCFSRACRGGRSF